MWLITTLIAAILTTILSLLIKKKYKLEFLSLMIWGATIMIFTDHVLGYKGGIFLKTETDGMVKNSYLLGIFMLIPLLIIWSVTLFISNYKKPTEKKS